MLVQLRAKIATLERVLKDKRNCGRDLMPVYNAAMCVNLDTRVLVLYLRTAKRANGLRTSKADS